MAYPDDLLSEGEEVLEHKHPHSKMLFWPTVAFVIVVGGGAYLAVLAGGLSWASIARIGILVVAVVLVCWLCLGPFVRWRTTHFIVTSDRVMAREGVLKRTGIDLPLFRINSVQFRQSIADRILGCGTLLVESASEEPLEFDDIPGVEQVHTVLYREVTDAIEEHERYQEDRS